MTNSIDVLIATAETKTRSVLWPGPPVCGDALLTTVRSLEGPWTAYLSDGVAVIWDDLGDEARLAAFLVAVDYAFSCDGASGVEGG